MGIEICSGGGGGGAGPTAPTDFVISLATANAQTLTWTDSPDEVYYIVEYSSDNITFANTALLQTGVVTTEQAGLSSATTYYYRIRAVNDDGLSDWVTTSGDTSAAVLTATNMFFNYIADTGFSLGSGNWTDNSGVGNTLAHNTGALPTLTDPWSGGREAVTYSSAYAIRATLTSAGNFLRYQSGTSAYKGNFFFVGSLSSQTNDGVWLYNISSGHYHTLYYNGGNLRWGSYGTGSFQSSVISAYTPGTKFVFGLNYKGSSSNFVAPWRYNTTSGSTNHNPGSVNAITRIYLPRTYAAVPGSATIAQCVGYNTWTNDTDFDNNFTALGDLWGIATS